MILYIKLLVYTFLKVLFENNNNENSELAEL